MGIQASWSSLGFGTENGVLSFQTCWVFFVKKCDTYIFFLWTIFCNIRVRSHWTTKMCFFMSSCVNSYLGVNASHLWRHDYNVKKLCRCRQVRTGPNLYLSKAVLLPSHVKHLHRLFSVRFIMMTYYLDGSSRHSVLPETDRSSLIQTSHRSQASKGSRYSSGFIHDVLRNRVQNTGLGGFLKWEKIHYTHVRHSETSILLYFLKLYHAYLQQVDIRKILFSLSIKNFEILVVRNSRNLEISTYIAMGTYNILSLKTSGH